MNNNTIQINSYLQNEMSVEERATFEIQLSIDKDLQYELEVQRNIMAAAVSAGMKIEFAKAIRQQFIYRQFIKWGSFGLIIVVILIVIFRHQLFSGASSLESQKITGQNDVVSSSPFINPPSASINVPFGEYSFDAAKGDTIYYPSGSIICFPSNAFVDASGNLIKGLVNINYREFADPVDFFVSGIPMDYDSAGKKYDFESSGMCEINAYQNNIPIFVNPQAQPQVNLSSNNKSSLHNLYVLDTVARKWKFIGKDKITEVKELAKSNNTKATANDYTDAETPLVAPVKPIKATPGRQAFSVEIEPGSFEELFTYDKQKFEVVETGENDYRPSDADEHWENVKLEKTVIAGVYKVTFSNPKRAVSYKVRPVLSGADYDAALKVFNEKTKTYEQALQKRTVLDKLANDSIMSKNKRAEEKWNAENEWNNQMNDLIIKRNKYLKEMQRLNREALAKRIKAGEELEKEQRRLWGKEQALAASQRALLIKNQTKYEKDITLSAEIIRTFVINRFGVWNCDHPQYPGSEIYIEATYTDNNNDAIYLPFASVVYRGFNGITQFPGANQIRLIPGSDNMILSIKDGLLYYFSYKDYLAAGISRNKNKYTFKMRKTDKEISSYLEIKELVDKL